MSSVRTFLSLRRITPPAAVELAIAGGVLIGLQLAITLLSGSFQPDSSLSGQPIFAFVGLHVAAGLVYLAVILVLQRDSGQPRPPAPSLTPHRDNRWAVVAPAILAPHRDSRGPGVLAVIAVCGLLLRAAAWPSQPILEDDFHRYLWDGATVSAAVSPYRFAPSEVLAGADGVPERLRLEALSGGDTVARINHPGLTTIYPPVAQAAFLLAHVVAPFSLGAFKAVLLSADLIAVWLVLRLLAVLGLPHWLVAAYWWNPLLVTATYTSAHMDVLLLPFVLGALLARIRRRPYATAVLLALATGVKLWPVLLAPLLLAPWLRRSHRRLLVPLVYVALAGVLLLPMALRLWAHSGVVSFAGRWEMNDALFASLSWLLSLPGALGDAGPAVLRVALAAGLVVVAGVLAWRDSLSPSALTRGALVVTAALLLASPAQFPWYFIWAVPLLALVPFAPLLALTAVLPLYYLRFHFEAVGDVASFDNGVVFLEWVPIWGWLLLALLRRRRLDVPPRPTEEG